MVFCVVPKLWGSKTYHFITISNVTTVYHIWFCVLQAKEGQLLEMSKSVNEAKSKVIKILE
jgi:hypothetical protein